MAVNIGPRIGIEGEAEYRKQLQNIIQQQRTLKSELKATESAFTSETTAQEKARVKAESLNKQIDLQKQRVEAAKRMVEESTKAYGEADDRTLKWKQALADATTELNKMEGELEKTVPSVKTFGEKLTEIGDGFTNVGTKMTAFGDTLTKSVTLPLAALGTASLKAFSDVDKGLDIVTQKTGATGEQLAELQDTVKDIASELPSSFENIGNAVGEINTRFGLTGEALKSLSEQFIMFAKINSTDVTTAVDNTQKALAAFGESTEYAGTLLDVLTATSQKTGVSVDLLLSGLIQNGTAFQEMGLSIDQAVAAMGMMETSGANAETVMQGLRKALKNAAADGIPLNDALSDLQQTILNGKDGVDGLTMAYELFGKSGDQIYGAVKNGTLDFEALGSAAVDAGGAVSETFANTLDAPTQLQVVLNNLKITGSELATSLFSVLAPTLEKLTGFVQSAANWFNSLDEKQKNLIVTIAAVIAIVAPVISIFGRLATGIGSIISVVSSLIPMISSAASAFAAFGAALLTNPVFLVVAGIVALIAAIKLLWDNCEWFREGVTAAWEAIKGAFEAVVNWFNGAIEDVKSFFTGLGDKITSVKDGIVNAWNNLKTNTSNAWNNIKSTVEANGGGIEGVVKTVADGLKSVWSDAFNAIDELTGGKLSSALSTVSNILTSIKDTFTNILGGARDKVKEIIDAIVGFFNIDISFPSIPLPHFSITPKGWVIGDLLKGKIPSLSIDWYRKAYDDPVIFNRPTVLPTVNGLKGFGDGRGAEVVIGMSRLQELVAENAAANQGTFSPQIHVYAQPGQDVNQIADAVMAKMQYQIERMVG